MIRMSLDKEIVLPHPEVEVGGIKVSPSFPADVLLSEEPKQEKTHPLRPKNGIQPAPNNPQAPPQAPQQRTGKRRYSLGAGFKHPFGKRRRRANSDCQSDPVLPSNFLMGGNIFDPLNLNSLLDEEVNRATNQETPRSSPLPARARDPVQILVPRDITDPLNLRGGDEGAEWGGLLLSPIKPRKRHRNRHHGGGGGGGGGEAGGGSVAAPVFPVVQPAVPEAASEGGRAFQSPLPYELNTSINCRDEVVTPILPRRHTHPAPGSAHKHHGDGPQRQRRRRRTTSMRSSEGAAGSLVSVAPPSRFQTPLVGGATGAMAGQRGGAHSTHPPPKKKRRDRYQYGNHSRYYGYQSCYGDRREGRVGPVEDPRLTLLKPDWFRGKRVLDIGCGAGHMTLAIARQFGPAHILGLDVDRRLVHAARQNIRHFLSHDLVRETRGGQEATEERMEEGIEEEKNDEKKEGAGEEAQQVMALLSSLPPSFPLSFRICRGPLAPPPLLLAPPTATFPANVTFITGNYVTETEVWPGSGQYDVIMCLGVTKWVQLQSGDGGVVRLFKRAYRSLPHGGMFIMEAQPWSSYAHSKRSTEETYKNYKTIRLRPENYTSHLTSQIGFTSYRLLTQTGNLRPIYLFHKGPAPRK
ncbi:7SK snRNA methylphosphate capping enzyme [Aplochiton taeniatus]